MAKRRRGHGEGSVYQRGDGYWVASVEAGGYPNGKRRGPGLLAATRPTGEFVDW